MMNQTKKQTYKPIGINRILEKDFHEKPPILDKGILPAGGGLILAGDSGVGKSLLRVEISIRLSIGLDVFGIRTPHAQTILVFQAENTSQQEQFRTKRVMQGLGIEQLPERIFYAPPIHPCSLLNDRFLKPALKLILETGATVVFFDPLISFHRENENENTRMRNVLDAITSLSRRSGAGSIVIHHFGKPPAGQPIELKYRMRGAMAIRDWADSAITVSGINDAASDLIRLDFIKIRNGPYHAPIVLERDRNFVHHITVEPGEMFSRTHCPAG